MMFDKLIFYNNFHFGDVHLSRTFVREIVKYATARGISCFYKHEKASEILYDIPGLSFVNQKHGDQQAACCVRGDTAYFNTWYAAGNFRYFHTYGLTYNCLYRVFDAGMKQLFGISLSNLNADIEFFVPQIDFSKTQIEKAKIWLSAHGVKKVLISNGNVLSGQASNFDFAPTICELANSFKDTVFIISNAEMGKLNINNVVYSKDIISKDGNDLMKMHICQHFVML